jgi:hypothetical protein
LCVFQAIKGFDSFHAGGCSVWLLCLSVFLLLLDEMLCFFQQVALFLLANCLVSSPFPVIHPNFFPSVVFAAHKKKKSQLTTRKQLH